MKIRGQQVCALDDRIRRMSTPDAETPMQGLAAERVSDASLREIDLALAAMADLKPLVEYGVPGTYDSVQARRKTALLRTEGALLYLRRELNSAASEVEAARASLPAPARVTGTIGHVAPPGFGPMTDAVAALRARPAEPTPDTALLRQCLEALTDRQWAVVVFSLQRFVSAALEQANEAAQDKEGRRYKSGAAEAFMRDADDATALISALKALEKP